MALARPMVFGTTVLGILSLTALAFGEEYYIANSGDNNNTGTSPDSPWADLSPVGRGGANTIRFKAGDTWEMSGLSIGNGAVYSTYGDGPRPTLIMVAGSGGGGFGGGGVSLSGGGTIEGIRIRAAEGSGATSGIMVSGSGNVARNCEIDGTDGVLQLGFGVMGEDNLITQNIVHDLSGMTGDSGDMNTSGGAEAYMIMGSGNEISYNSAINCWGPNKTLGGAEGGCLEIVNGKAGSVIENVRFHHNYCERSVGLFEGCSGNFQGTDKIQENHGIIRNSYVGYNISVDAMWLYLLQPVNTDFENMVFEHNTLVHSAANGDIPQRGAESFGLLVNDDAGYTFTLKPGDITVRDNLFVVLEGAASAMFSPPPDGDHYNNIFVPSAPMGLTLGEGELAVAEAGLSETYRLLTGSEIIDKGSADTPVYSEDIDGHPVPCGNAQDPGASEYCDNMGGAPSAGGAPAASGGSEQGDAGAPSLGNGGADQGVSGSGPGQGGAGESPPPVDGGATSLGNGGSANPPVGSGGASDLGEGGLVVTAAGSPATGSGGTSLPVGSGGAPQAGAGSIPSTGVGGSQSNPNAGTSPTSGGPTTGPDSPPAEQAGAAAATEGAAPPQALAEDDLTSDDGGCGCRIPGGPTPTHNLAWIGILAGLAALGRRRLGLGRS